MRQAGCLFPTRRFAVPRRAPSGTWPPNLAHTRVCPTQSSFLKSEVIATIWNLGNVTWEIKGVWFLCNDQLWVLASS